MKPTTIPEKAYLRALKTGKRVHSDELVIVNDPYWACHYARDVIKGRWPEAEPHILTNSEAAYLYATYVLRGRWPEAEAIILSSTEKDWTTPNMAYSYAHDVIGDRWPEAEAIISKDPEFAFRYAKDIICRRWPEAEAIIAKSKWKNWYVSIFPEAREDWAMIGWLDWLDS